MLGSPMSLVGPFELRRPERPADLAARRHGGLKAAALATTPQDRGGGRGNKRRLHQPMCAARPSAPAKLVRDVSCVGDQRQSGLVQHRDQIAASRDLSLFDRRLHALSSSS